MKRKKHGQEYTEILKRGILVKKKKKKMETRICMENVWAKYGCFNESKIDEGRQKQAGMCECALFL